MLQTLKRLVWGEEQKAALPRTMAPGDNDAYWDRLFQGLCKPHGTTSGRGGFDFNPRALPRGEAWMIDARFPFRSEGVVEKFTAWASALVRIEDAEAEMRRVKALPADLDGAVRFFMQRVRDERATAISELMAGVDAQRFYDPARRGFPSLAGLLADSAFSGLDSRQAEREGVSTTRMTPKHVQDSHDTLTFAGRMYLFSLGELDVSAWLAANPPAGEVISDADRSAKLADLKAQLDASKAEADKLGQASGRVEDGRDTWLAHYYAARILNASAASPCDSVGREADDKTAEALAALGIVNGLKSGSLFQPTNKPLAEFKD